jgi:hypothetical protein
MGEDTNNPNCLIIFTVRLDAIGIVNPLVAINFDDVSTSSALTATMSMPAALTCSDFA